MKNIYLLTLLLIGSITNVQSATLVVMNTNDSGAGSLRQAVIDATTGDDIIFDNSLVGSSIFLSTVISVDKNLTLTGFSSGSTVTIDGGFTTRLFSISISITVSFNWLNFIKGGVSTGGAMLNNGDLYLDHCRFNNNHSNISSVNQGGGALYNNTNGNLTVNYCEFYGNFAEPTGPSLHAYGGAIYNRGVNMSINYSSFYNNTASSGNGGAYGGAIYNTSAMDINSCTFSQNDSNASGNATGRGGSIANKTASAVTSIKNSTIVNSSCDGMLRFGGNIWSDGTVTLENTILSGGDGNSGGNDIYTFSPGVSTSLGYNIIEDIAGSGITLMTGDQSVDPILDPLDYYASSFTKVHKLGCGSPAIDAGNNTSAPAFDQIGQTRIFNTTIDVGAYEIQVLMSPADVTSSASSYTICGGESTVLTANSVGSASYTWNQGLGSGQNQTVFPTTTTTYIVTGTVVATGCSDTSHITINVNSSDLPNLSLVALTNPICEGQETTLLASAPGNGSLTWSWNNGITSTSNQIDVSPSSTTSYIVTATIVATGCSDIEVVTINVNPLPSVLASTNFPSGVCPGEEMILTGTLTNGTYSWDNGLGAGDTQTIYPTATTTYSVTGTDATTGCSNTSSVSAVVLPQPVLSLTAQNNPICLGDSAELIANVVGGGTYVWNNGLGNSATHTVTPATTTTYVVTGSDANCSATDSIAIVVNALPSTPLITANTFNLSTGVYDAYQWYVGGVLIPSATSQDIIPTQNGVYTVEVFNSNGCSSISSDFNLTTASLVSYDEDKLSVYPNPFNSVFSISANSVVESIQIYDVIGNLVYESNVSASEVEIDLSFASSGSYLLIMEINDEKVQKRIVKK